MEPDKLLGIAPPEPLSYPPSSTFLFYLQLNLIVRL